MSYKLDIHTVETAEWYDGLVSGLIRTDKGDFAACLMAYNADSGRRKYALISIPSIPGDQILAILNNGGLGEDLNTLWNQAIQMADSVFLSDAEPVAGESLVVESATPDERGRLDSYTLPCIDTAVSDRAVSFWLDSK